MNLLLLVFVSRAGLENTRNILLVNLALSDLLSALTLPATAWDALWSHWSDLSLTACRSVTGQNLQ